MKDDSARRLLIRKKPFLTEKEVKAKESLERLHLWEFRETTPNWLKGQFPWKR